MFTDVDNSGSFFITVFFNGSGFFRGSRTVQMVLGVKLKLGFIDGTCIKLEIININY